MRTFRVPTTKFRIGRAAVSAAVAIAGLGAAPSIAAARCPQSALSTPFSAWGDHSHYFLVNGGDFTWAATAGAGAGWQFSGGASAIIDPTAPSGYAVRIPRGGSVTTPLTCVSAGDPSARMFAYTPVSGVNMQAGLQAEILYANGASRGVGSVPQMASWGPTRKLSLATGSLPLDGNGEAWIQYRFSALSGSTWELDDIYIDPRMG